MKILMKTQYGSHLYGTATSSSDLDIKGIFIPCSRDILLQRVPPVITTSRVKLSGERNTAEDIDCELYSPEKFLLLLKQGQSVALEMLFAPDAAMLEVPHPAWETIKQIAPVLLTKQAASFVNYCRKQAHKYSAKGARIAAAKVALEKLLEAERRFGSSAKLSEAAEIMQQLVLKNKFLTIGEVAVAGVSDEWYFEVCGKKALFNASIKSACLMVKKIIDEYGQRALEAENNNGIDWKALSHAIRVGYQSLEFFKKRFITFPRPEACHLLAIKQGNIPFEQVIEELEQLVIDVEAAAASSGLPATCNHKVIDDFIEQLYVKEILEDYHGR